MAIIKKYNLFVICFLICIQVVFNCFADDKKKDNKNEKPANQSNLEQLKNEFKKQLDERTKKSKDVDNQPDLVFEDSEYDFGEIYRGNRAEHIFTFTNKGKSELNIEKVRSSCGCTAAIISSKKIAPNESGEIKVTFNSGSYNGKVSKNVTVYSDDPDTPTYKVSISGTVVEEVSAKPERVDFSKVPFESGATRNISVKSEIDFKLKIKKIDSTNPNIEATFEKVKDKNEYIIAVSLKKDTDYGRINGNILIYTNSKNQEKLTIPVYGEVIGDISVYPPRISCGSVKQNKEMAFPVFVMVYNNDVKIERVEANPKFINAEINEMESKMKTYKVMVILQKNAPVGKINGGLKIFTNSKTQPLVEIPITGTVMELS